MPALLLPTGCTEETLKQVLYPLQLACASNMQVRFGGGLLSVSCVAVPSASSRLARHTLTLLPPPTPPQKVVELALGCLHKLVAHAWLHGESTAAGTMDILSAHGSLDDDDTVANGAVACVWCGRAGCWHAPPLLIQ